MSEPTDQKAKFHDKRCIKLFDSKTKGLRLATKAELAIILRHCKTPQLWPFFRECEGARSFSRYFWWAVKGGKRSRAT